MAFGVNFLYKCMAAENKVAKVSIPRFFEKLIPNFVITIFNRNRFIEGRLAQIFIFFCSAQHGSY